MTLPPPPPSFETLPYGTILQTGTCASTIIAGLDFETFSEAGFIWNPITSKFDPPPGAKDKGLPTIGAAVYAMHPSTEVLSAAYDLKDGTGEHLWLPGQPPPLDLFEHLQRGRLLQAWNMQFEYWIWTYVCTRRYGWPQLPVRQLRCAQAKSRAHALPASLDGAGTVLDISHKKHADGRRLIMKFSVPHNPTKHNARTRVLMADEPEDGGKFIAYNIQDIRAEAEISRLCPDLSPFELEFWLCDQAINRRGVRLDRQTIEAARDVIEQTALKYNAELRLLTRGHVGFATEVQAIRKWLLSMGVHTETLDMEDIEEILKQPLLPKIKRVLEIRQLLGSAAVKKIYAMLNTMDWNDRVHDLFAYHSARTGRAAGQGVQPQNLPNSGLDVLECLSCKRYFVNRVGCAWCGSNRAHTTHEWNPKATEDAVECIRTRSADLVEMFFSNPIKTVSSCLRGMFIPADGCDFICSDYASIEPIVLAILAGEQWQIDVFNSHGMIYEMTASRITGVPFEEFIRHKKETGKHHEDRKLGKTAVLSSGYGGWIGAWINFKANEFLTEEQIKAAILAWRTASPAIVEFWGGQTRGRYGHMKQYYGLEGAGIQAIMKPGEPFTYRSISYVVINDVMYCTLPSGRKITYHRPRLAPSTRAYRENTLEITFEGWNSNPKQGKVGWIRMSTYGGKLTENVVQAVARDILAYAIVALEAAGYPVVMHVHDEIVVEVPECFGSVEEVERIMSTMPAWASDWTIKARGGWRAKRYAK
jgi:DNA polymerase